MASVDELAVKYSSQLSQLQAIFPSWDEEDLVFTLQDVKGNVEEAAMMITEGRAAQFTQASRKKPVKSKETSYKAHTNRNADSGGWEAVNGDEGRGSRGGRGGRGGARGGRGGRGGEPFRGGRGGRGGFRGGRGGFAGVNGQAKPTPTEGPTTTATTEEGWASQVEQASTSAVDGAQEAENAAPVESSNNEDFSGSGGWGDAPAPKEIEKAAKAGGKGWQKDLDKPVPVASSTVPSAPAAKPKLTWAQIAKPIEKPKPVPAPAPVVPEPQPEPEPEITSDEPVAQEQVEAAPEALEETAAEPVKAWGDAPAPEEVKEEAAAVAEPEVPAEEPFTSPSAEDLLPEEPAAPQEQSDAWESDPAIAGSGAQPDWAKTESQQPAAAAPEPATTYQGPPGFSSVIAKAAPGVQVAQQPRSSSRAAQRYKDAEGQGVVLPPTAGGVSSVEMQFGSLSFGGLNGDGVDSPVPAAEPKQETPVQAAPAPAPVAASPVRSTQPSAPVPSAQPQQQSVAPTPAAAPAASAPYYQQQQSAQSQAPQPQQPQSYTAPHQTLQQQMQAYQYLQQQQAPAQTHTQDHTLHQPQGNQFYRQHDFYNPIGSQPQQTETPGQQPQQQQQQQQQSQQQQPTSSPYDAPFGAFGQQSHLFGQSAQQQNQHSQANDPYGAAQRSYDSYSASGYARPPVEESKPAAPAPSHTPTAPTQPPHQQSGYYSQMGNMGYYQQGPYNPYYQYGQAPQAGFQQYYPLAARNLYGQPAPQAPPAPIPQSTKPQAPASQSPYGVPPSYPSSASYDDQSFGGLGRYGDSKPQQAGQGQTQGAQTGAAGGAQSTLNSSGGPYNSQPGAGAGAGLHNFLGSNAISAPGSGAAGSGQASRPQATTPEDGFKSAQGVQARPQGNNNVPQAQGGQGFGSYPYGGGYGGQDWGQYGGQHYGSRNGYSHWQQ
ncbi:hypothetical protein CI109_106385 [Kwoniella shandongensis]|uniref:RNA polymerase II degradation factor 1 n=1 Tax=Kwoniella shandongensis TaxID=1734106 RepID=A0A5M6BW04_9TREE|nr:uncharacterized protein CI109_005908 [Kwoniella shandongensis]KAA5525745.1 hypothetical protein CI109_005908 [Kwoniella shandongensis]